MKVQFCTPDASTNSVVKVQGRAEKLQHLFKQSCFKTEEHFDRKTKQREV